jgi:hypothetical protein
MSTNEEIMMTRTAWLSPIEKQRRFLLEQALMTCPCPNCNKPSNRFAAANIALNDFTFDGAELDYACPHCKTPLTVVVPLMVFGARKWLWSKKFEDGGGKADPR